MNARVLTLTLMLVFSTFSSVFAPEPTAVLDEPIVPQRAGNTVDCGTNASNVSFEVEAYQPVWNRYDTVSAFLDTYCGVWWKTYRVDWLLVSQDNSSVIDYGQSTFTTNNSSVTYHPNHTDHFNEVDVHFHYMDTGNYSLSGNFYVLDNTTWTWLANVSNTFQVNSTDSTTACGYNDTLVSMETDISSNFYFEGASAYPWSDIECPVLGTPYGYSWELFDQNSSAVFQTGSSNFTASWQNVHPFSDGSGIYHDINIAVHNLTEGVYTLSTVLTLSNGSYVDSANLTFQVWANNSGGGNQTNTGCGYDSNLTAIYAYSWQSIFNVGNMFESTVNSYCNLLGSTTMIEWTVYHPSNWTIVAQDNTSWYVNSTSDSLTVNHAGFDEGNYAFVAKLSVWDNNTPGWNFITDSVYNFSYVASNGNLSSGQLDIDTYNETFAMGDELSASFSSTALVIGEMYYLDWGLYDASQVKWDGGNFTWMAYSNTSIEWQNYTVDGAPIDYGTYCFYGNLFHLDANYSATWLTQDDTCFTVEDPGSNNTGGNNTGSNMDYDGYLDDYCYGLNESIIFYLEISVPGETNFTLEWEVTDSNQNIVASDAVILTLDSSGAYSSTLILTPTDGSSFFEAGQYTFMANPAHSNNLSRIFDDSPYYYDFEVDCIGGNNTGGNNTTDSDGDGVEDVLDAFPTDPTEWSDDDLDGVGDNSDNCYSYSNPNQADWDNDSFGDICDWDDDNDNVNDPEDAFPYDPSEWSDSDSDGVGDNSDNCPNQANTNQSDADNNGIGDACDTNSGGNGNNTTINTPPVISGVTISPNMPQSDDSLTCMYTTFDAEGDSVTTTVAWNVNGNTIASGTDTISTGYAVGDEVQCVVSGSDGQAPGNTDSDTVTILPTVSDVEDGAGNGLPALGSVGTLLAIAIGVGLTRRQDD